VTFPTVKGNKVHAGAGQHPINLLTLVFLLTFFLPLNALTAEQSQERPLEKITIAFSSVSANMAPLWITQEHGFFRKYGLDVQSVFIESGSTTVQSLISKEVVFAQMAGAGVLRAVCEDRMSCSSRDFSTPGLSTRGR
jgi:ABC-type nitrate/sulfonate/bicarbonate transport system substrate-binding protein